MPAEITAGGVAFPLPARIGHEPIKRSPSSARIRQLGAIRTIADTKKYLEELNTILFPPREADVSTRDGEHRRLIVEGINYLAEAALTPVTTYSALAADTNTGAVATWVTLAGLEQTITVAVSSRVIVTLQLNVERDGENFTMHLQAMFYAEPSTIYAVKVEHQRTDANTYTAITGLTFNHTNLLCRVEHRSKASIYVASPTPATSTLEGTYIPRILVNGVEIMRQAVVIPAGGGGGGVTFYDPDSVPATVAMGEEYTDGAESLTWRWGNQGGAAMAYYGDLATLTAPAATRNSRVRWLTPPAGSWMAACKISLHRTNEANALPICGPIVLETGNEATPTLMSQLLLQGVSGSSLVSAYTRSSYTSAYTIIAAAVSTLTSGFLQLGLWMYGQLIYDDSTKVMLYRFSMNGIVWVEVASRTLGAAPPSIGWAVDTTSSTTSGPETVGAVKFYRVFNDGVHNAAPYLIGEP